MPFRMGPYAWGWWPYRSYWMRQRFPGGPVPYGYPYPPYSQEKEKAFLENQAKILENQLSLVKKRLEELKKQKKAKNEK